MDQDAIIAAIYDATTEPSRWEGVLTQLADLVGAGTSAMVMQNRQSGAGQAIHIRTPGPIWHEYFGYYATRNVLLQGTDAMRTGDVVTDQDLVPKATLRASEYFNDFLMPNGMTAMLGLAVHRDAQDLCAINLMRGPGQDEYGEDERRLMRPLMPHLQRAFAITLQLEQTRVQSAFSEALLDALPHAAALLDAQGRMVFANARARACNAERDGLGVSSHGLRGATADTTKALHAAVAQAQGTTMKLPRPAGRPLVANLVPVRSPSSWMTPSRHLVLLTASDPDAARVPKPALLQSLYGLTPAEARFVMRIAEGATVRDAAEQLGIGMPTARQHLSRALAKTGAGRQAELMRLLMATFSAIPS